jgi:hypothetical protein
MPSTVIQRVAYAETTHRLSVWFVPSGLRYDYFDVPPELFAGFRTAGAKGRFFNARIRDRFVHALVPDGDGSLPPDPILRP